MPTITTIHRHQLSSAPFTVAQTFDFIAPDGVLCIEWSGLGAAWLTRDATWLVGWLTRKGLLPPLRVNGADFRNTCCAFEDFTEVSMRNSLFASADLHRAKFVRAELAGSDFRNAQVTRTDFTGADLTGTNFCGAIRGVDDPAIPGWRVVTKYPDLDTSGELVRL